MASKFDLSTLNVASLNVDTIKQNLITFLKQYPEFTDYDLSNPSSASGLFLSILAANTAYNGFYLQQALTNAFISSATNKKSLLLLASNLGILVKDSTSSRTTVTLSNTGSSALPQYSVFNATSSNGTQISMYNAEEIPAGSEFTTELIAGYGLTEFGNFDLVTQSLTISYEYDPTTIVVTVNDEVWTRVDSTTNVENTKIYSIINSIDGYVVTTNIQNSEGIQNDDKIIITAIKSTGNSVSDITISSSPTNIVVTGVAGTVIGQASRSVDLLKTFVVNTVNCKNRLVTEQDYKDAVVLWLGDNDITVTDDDVSVTSPDIGTVRVYVSGVSGELQGNLVSYLNGIKMAGISVEFGA